MLRARANHEYTFFNRSRHTLKTLQGDADTLEQNLRDYVNAFSSNVRDIFEQYKFEDVIIELANHDLLLQILQHFARVNLHPNTVGNDQMGNIFEELIRRFAEASNETAGEHFTPREVIELMVTLLLTNDEDLATPHIIRDVYDPTAGTGGMLSVADDKIHVMNPTAQVNLLGQELNPESYAICKADMVVKGQHIDNIRRGNTLTEPAFENRTFHYCLSNPPFGVDWKNSRTAVEDEHKHRGFAGRFGPGLPPVSDGSLLFLLHLVSKMREPIKDDAATAGRGAIVLNGSPLFTGGAGSGPSNIRKWLLESDYLEAIIGLPTDMFYNTGISTYIWLLNKDKPKHRRGKVQLIDATDMATKLRKSVGSKRNELSPKAITDIAEIYEAFEESKLSKIFANEDFFYRTITVERPLKLNYAFTADRVERVFATSQVRRLKDSEQSALREALDRAVLNWAERATELASDSAVSMNRVEFNKQLHNLLNDSEVILKPTVLRAILDALSESDEDGELVFKGKSPAADTKLRDTENVPWAEDIHEYFEREVKPFVPDAWIDESKTREGAEIPFTRHFYEYVPPRPLEEIDRDLDEVLGRIRARLEQVKL